MADHTLYSRGIGVAGGPCEWLRQTFTYLALAMRHHVLNSELDISENATLHLKQTNPGCFSMKDHSRVIKLWQSLELQSQIRIWYSRARTWHHSRKLFLIR